MAGYCLDRLRRIGALNLCWPRILARFLRTSFDILNPSGLQRSLRRIAQPPGPPPTGGIARHRLAPEKVQSTSPNNGLPRRCRPDPRVGSWATIVVNPDYPADETLMARLAGGESSALNELVRRWETPLLAFTYRYLGNREEARDAVQETFVRLYRNRHRYRIGAPFRSWIFSIAGNLCRNRLRWLSRHPDRSGPDEADWDRLARTDDPEAGADPATRLLRAEELRLLRRAIDRLPHKLRTTILLQTYEGMEQSEIAAVLGCSRKAVEMLAYRARRALSRELEGSVGEPPMGGPLKSGRRSPEGHSIQGSSTLRTAWPEL